MKIRLKQNNSEIVIDCRTFPRAVELAEKLLPYSYSSELWIQLAGEKKEVPEDEGNKDKSSETITHLDSTPKEETESSPQKQNKPGRIPKDIDWERYKELKSEGKTMKEIAEAFFISEGTLFNRVKARREVEKREGVKA